MEILNKLTTTSWAKSFLEHQAIVHPQNPPAFKYAFHIFCCYENIWFYHTYNLLLKGFAFGERRSSLAWRSAEAGGLIFCNENAESEVFLRYWICRFMEALCKKGERNASFRHKMFIYLKVLLAGAQREIKVIFNIYALKALWEHLKKWITPTPARISRYIANYKLRCSRQSIGRLGRQSDEPRHDRSCKTLNNLPGHETAQRQSKRTPLKSRSSLENLLLSTDLWLSMSGLVVMMDLPLSWERREWWVEQLSHSGSTIKTCD